MIALRTLLLVALAAAMGCVVGYRLGQAAGRDWLATQILNSSGSFASMHTTCCADKECWLARADGQCHNEDRP